MINIFRSGANEHIKTIYVAESLHSPNTTTQLSGARSTTELIAHRAGLLTGRRPAIPRAKKTCPYLSSSFRRNNKINSVLSACSDLR